MIKLIGILFVHFSGSDEIDSLQILIAHRGILSHELCPIDDPLKGVLFQWIVNFIAPIGSIFCRILLRPPDRPCLML